MSNNEPDLPKLEKGKYRHNKTGNLYEVIGVALHSEQVLPVVVYKPLYDSKYELCVRPYEVFVDSVVLNGKTVRRFEKINN